MNDKNNPFLKSLLEDNSGGFSTARFMALFWAIGVFLIWGIGSIFLIYTTSGADNPTVTLLPIPGEVVTIVLGFAGFKTIQRFGEKPEIDDESIKK